MSGLIAVIPARGGTKRLPGKNIRPLGGRPLIAWTIDAARASGCFDRILVSTDDSEIAATARTYGAEVPWMRSPELASDTAVVADAVIELLARLTEAGEAAPEGIALLQPTSPFRSVNTIRRGCELYTHAGGESVVSVSRAGDHPYWMHRIEADGSLKPFLELPPELATTRSQDLPPVYVLNGLLYIAHPHTIQSTRGFYSEATRALPVDDPAESVDIDTPFDWAVAEAFLTQRGSR